MASGSGAKKTKEDKSDIIYVNLSIVFQDGHRLYFKVHQDLQLSRVFREFCQRQKLDYDGLKFIYDGAQVKGTQTPKMVNMEDGAEIFAARHQLGG
ncbi:small ubiquitin-related modifier 1 [Cajanus cajan]|nr:small ubiquitin-related modifier 1 [Cajanus cajan]